MNIDPKIYPNVFIDNDSLIEEQCIIGIVCKPVPLNKKTKIGKNALIRSGTYIYEDNLIGDYFTTGNRALIRESNVIGNNVSIGSMTSLGHNIEIGDDVRIHSQCFIPEFSIIRKGAWIGPGVFLTNSKYPNQVDSKKHLKGPTIKEEAVIGANVTILPNITIGCKSIIGAGSVVTKDVPENKIFAGNPAREINK